MKKILRINNIMTPTWIAFFNYLNKYFLAKWYSFKVIYLSKSESNRIWDLSPEKIEFNFSILNSKQLEVKWLWNYSFYMHYNTWIIHVLDEQNPDIIVHDWWASFSARQSQSWCKKHNKKFILKNESTQFEKSWRRTMTKPLVRNLVKRSNWYISSWSRSKEYLETLGANDFKICEFYDWIDNDFFVNQYSKLKKGGGSILKKKYWVQTKYSILFVWQMVKLKWIYDIIEWFKIFSKRHKDWSLLMVWDWQERKNILEITKKQWINNVIMPWFIEKSLIWELYTIADVFTLPSYSEVWWFVVNEAMCFWLPILTAFEVWASADLVIEWETWYIMKEHSPEEWCKWLEYLIKNDLINNNQSQEHISKFSYDKFIPNIKMFLN